jgi:predicted ATPase
MGETPELFPALWLLWEFRSARAEHHRALELAEQISSLAESVEDPLQVNLAHVAVGTELMYLGDFAAAREHLEKLVRLYDPKEHGSLAFVYGQDPGVSSLIWLSWTLWFLGYPDQATHRAREALDLARKLEHPFTLAFALSVTAVDPILRRDDPVYKDRISELTRLATEKGFAFYLARTMSDKGFDEVCAGRSEEGLAQMRQGLDILQAMGTDFHRPHFLAFLAEALARAGKPDEGLGVLSEALAFVERTGERLLEAELHRLNGELLLMNEGSEIAAEGSFHRAIDTAERQRAKSLELRAVTSLARLWWKQGKPHDARERLAAIYAWFTEGFDSPDLKEAKVLLDELASV